MTIPPPAHNLATDVPATLVVLANNEWNTRCIVACLKTRPQVSSQIKECYMYHIWFRPKWYDPRMHLVGHTTPEAYVTSCFLSLTRALGYQSWSSLCRKPGLVRRGGWGLQNGSSRRTLLRPRKGITSICRHAYEPEWCAGVMKREWGFYDAGELVAGVSKYGNNRKRRRTQTTMRLAQVVTKAYRRREGKGTWTIGHAVLGARRLREMRRAKPEQAGKLTRCR